MGHGDPRGGHGIGGPALDSEPGQVTDITAALLMYLLIYPLREGSQNKKGESMVFDHRGVGRGVTQNQIFIQNYYQYIEC